ELTGQAGESLPVAPAPAVVVVDAGLDVLADYVGAVAELFGRFRVAAGFLRRVRGSAGSLGCREGRLRVLGTGDRIVPIGFGRCQLLLCGVPLGADSLQVRQSLITFSPDFGELLLSALQ